MPDAVKEPVVLNYDYAPSRAYCRQVDLVWLGDDWVADADREAKSLGFTQEQVNAAMRHHLWHMSYMLHPKNYRWKQRLLMAAYFLVGWKPKAT